MGDSPKAHPHREAPWDAREQGCTEGQYSLDHWRPSPRCFRNPAALLRFSTSPLHSPRCLLAGTSTWIPFSLQPHVAKSRSPTSLPLSNPRPLAGWSWPATMTPRPYLLTLALQGGSFWERVTRRCPAPWSWSLLPLWTLSSKSSKSRFVVFCSFRYCCLFLLLLYIYGRDFGESQVT